MERCSGGHNGVRVEKLAGMQEWSDLASVRRVEPKMIREFRKVK